jgi:hypothetical protein
MKFPNRHGSPSSGALVPHAEEKAFAAAEPDRRALFCAITGLVLVC